MRKSTSVTENEYAEQFRSLGETLEELSRRLEQVETTYSEWASRVDEALEKSVKIDESILETFSNYQDDLNGVIAELEAYHTKLMERIERVETNQVPQNTVGVETLKSLQERFTESLQSIQSALQSLRYEGQLDAIEERLSGVESDIERLYRRLSAIEAELENR